jgi:hypothetical protein
MKKSELRMLLTAVLLAPHIKPGQTGVAPAQAAWATGVADQILSLVKSAKGKKVKKNKKTK